MRTDTRLPGTQWLSLILCLALLSGPAALAGDSPPIVPAAVLKQALQNLQRQGKLLSLDYEHGVYLIEILSAQGLRQRFRLDSGGRLIRELSWRGDPPVGLMPLETLLARAFGGQGIQLLEAELEQAEGKLVYELKWLQQGRFHKAHFDARSGRRLESD